ncbi:MAG: hypothetical protein IJ366_09465, partial [Clostridia bacterium]|nr:hypothetical protein [Clostridia bacterium]
MPDGIYYNQEVTAEMLNGIAHDLGNTSFNGFGTEKFGADALNDITKDLVSAGVLLTGNKCRVIRSTEDNSIILQDGVIVFNNGAKKVIGSPLTIDADNSTVIYALNNQTAGTCTIEVAEEYPTEGDIVKLCSVNADGTLKDDRAIAQAKMSLNAGNTQMEYEFSEKFSYTTVYQKIISVPRLEWESYTNVLFKSTPTGQDLTGVKPLWELRKDIEFDTEYSGAGSTGYFSIKFVETDDAQSIEVYGMRRGCN